MKLLKLAIVGAGGRMGRSLLENASHMAGLQVVAAIVRPDSPRVGAELGIQGLRGTTDLSAHIDACDVVIDFSTPESAAHTARIAADAGTPFVSGTTGLGPAHLEALDACAQETAVLHAANFSVGVNVLARLVELASQATADGFDLEIFEAHHNRKVDAPSGTALLLGRAAAAGRGQELEDVAQWARHGQVGAREADEIGFSVVRGGDIVGEHTVFACGHGERLELTHRATDRGIFARGALHAARWIFGREPGAYTMNDMLFRS